MNKKDDTNNPIAKANGYGYSNSTEILENKKPIIVSASDLILPFGWSSVSAIAPPRIPNARVPPNLGYPKITDGMNKMATDITTFNPIKRLGCCQKVRSQKSDRKTLNLLMRLVII